ncbi:MAG: hypothetical protein U5N53_09020 [Mycobacterium sp.]|nr:hypothetical protein [Mycobacterium sp.]
MFLQFVTPKGNPAYVRPDQVDALIGYHASQDGRPVLATRIILRNREIVFVLGDVDAIKDAIKDAIEAVLAPTPEPLRLPTGERVDPMTGEVVEPYRALVEGSI